MRAFLLLLAFMFSALPANAQRVADSPKPPSIADFSWSFAGRHKVGDLSASFDVIATEAIAVGPEAVKVMQFLQGTSGYEELQGVVFSIEGPMENSFITIEHNQLGYIRDDDWADVDAESLLQTVKENTAEANKERIAKGVPVINVVGWTEKPHYDRPTKTVWWAIKGDSEDGPVINAVALKLARNGYSRFVWVGQPNQFLNAVETLKPSLERYKFDEGHRYADFRAGDAVAAVGIAGLTASLVTGKGGKAAAVVGAGLLAIALAFVKKAWLLIFLPILAIGAWFRKRNSRT